MDRGTSDLAEQPEPAGPGGEPEATDTDETTSWAVSPTTYWRRRVVAFAAGIVLLGTLAWAVNGAVGHGSTLGQAAAAVAARGSHAKTGHTAHGHRGGAVHTADTAPRTGPLHGLRPGTSPSPRQGQTGSPAAQQHQPTGSAAPAPTSPLAAPSQPGASRWCPAADVMLNLFTPRYLYLRGQQPEFVIAAVSTAAQACRFDLSTKSVSVVVSTGSATVWSSADCSSGTGSNVVALAPGKPALQWVTWDRRRSPRTCGSHGRPVRKGTYTATALGPRMRSSTMVFVLGGPGVAVP